MAVVNQKSNLFRKAPGDLAADALFARGRVRRATGRISNGSTDSNGSKYLMAELPSHVILGWATNFYVQNWGFATVRLGTFDDNDALLNVAKSAANNQAPITAQIAAGGQPLWQALGLASDPGGVIGLYAHAIADATGAGTLDFTIEWVDNV